MTPVFSGYFGSHKAVERYVRYSGYEYRHHCDYMTLGIYRAYDGPQPKAMYRAIVADGTIIVSVNLDGIKCKIKEYLKGVNP